MLQISASRHWPFLSVHRVAPTAWAIGSMALVVSMLAGSTFNSFAKTLTTALTPLSLVFLSEILTLSFILFSFGLVPTVRRLCQLSRAQLIPLLVLGCLSGIIGPTLWFSGIHLTTAVNASLFGKVEMIYTIVLAAIVLKERITYAHAWALGGIFIGVLFISLRGFTETVSWQTGDIVIILAALSYATAHLIFRKYLSHLDPQLAILARCTMAITMFLVISPFLESSLLTEVKGFPWELVPVLLAFAFISRFLNGMCLFAALDRLPISSITLVSTLEIILSVSFAALYLHEAIEWYHVVGGMFIILGNILLELLGAHPHEEAHVQHTVQRLPHKP